MKVLWVCNIMLPMIAEKLNRGSSNKEGWISGLMSALTVRCGSELELGVAFPVMPGEELVSGSMVSAEGCKISYFSFHEDTVHPEKYDYALEMEMRSILTGFEPQVLHLFGTEFPHTLAAVRAFNKPEKTLIGIQGLCAVYADAYMANLPDKVQSSKTFRDIVKRDTLKKQHEKFVSRGKNEIEAIKLVSHIAGRTHWDKYWAKEWNPDVQYHVVRETLRTPFYEDMWSYETCEKYSLFMSQGDYPIKGLHYMLLAMPEILRSYPKAHLTVAGNCILREGSLAPLKISAYGAYLQRLITEGSLEEKVTFSGSLNGQQMKEHYLKANAYVCCSTAENSPNSLGEAMLLGTPVVTTDIGGITTMMAADEGWIFEGYREEKEGEAERIAHLLAENICAVFEAGDKVTDRTLKARTHAADTHNGAANLQQLLDVYAEIIAG